MPNKQPPIDFVRITPLRIYVHLINGEVDEYHIVAYPQFGMVHFAGSRGEYPIAPYNLYQTMPVEELVEMIHGRVVVFYRNLGLMLGDEHPPRSPHPLFNRNEYGE